MQYLPLPRTVVPAVVFATVVLVMWLGWGSMQDPETFWAPGDLSRYHADIARCTSCHEPFRGPLTAKCILCHSEARFAERSMPSPAAFHHEIIRHQQSCLGCHTEHRGARARITSSAAANPHGDVVFSATGTTSCTDCHVFGPPYGSRPTVNDNDSVRRLLAAGRSAHRPGHMAHCLQCHAGKNQ
jgi:hypothetical protein